MERSSSKEEVDSVSVHSRYRRSDIDPNTMFLEHKPKDSQMSIVDHIRNHPNIKVLSNEKIEMLRKYMEDSQKPRGFKQLRMVCKSFIDKCASASLGILIDKAYEQFFQFLRQQKRIDDEKMRKLSALADDWSHSKKKSKDWRAPLQQYFQHDKSKSNKKGWVTDLIS